MNDYEQLIEMMFADGTLDQSVRQEIEGMNDLQKRLHIVKILDKGLGLFTKIEGIMNLRKMDYIKNILMILKSYVLIADVEKKKFGEVMTPLTLIKDMLNTLPEDVWSNPELKWLDPANGTGPYPIMVIYKLMAGLKDWEPDDEKRYKHIIERMIYVSEIQPKNMFLYMNAVDPMNEYNLNIYTGSFLEKEFDTHMKTVWNIDNFYLVIGNPPYQDPDNKRLPLWQSFLKKSLNLLKNNGYINYVHPSAWRKPKHELLETIKNNNLVYLNINSQQDGVRVFGAGTRFDYYLLQKNKYNGVTKIIDEDNNEHILDIKKMPFIPHSSLDILDSIISNKKELNVIHSRSMYGNDKKHMSKTQNDINQYPCVYSTPCRGDINFLYSSIISGHFGINKIIIGKASPENCFYDNGQYGVTNNCFAIEVENLEIANEIINCIKGDRFKKFINNCKWSGYSFEHEVFEFLKTDFWKEFNK